MSCDEILELLNTFNALTKKPTKFLRAQEDKIDDFKKFIKCMYDFTKVQEIENSDVVDQDEALPALIVDEFDEEQIWQEIELQNSAKWQHFIESVSSGISSEANLWFPIEQKHEVETKCEEEDGKNSLKFESKNQDEKQEKAKKAKSVLKKKGKDSAVDDDFFKLNEMERFLEQEDKREMLQEKQQKANDSDEDSIDLFEDDSDMSEEGDEENDKRIRYKDFFDGPSDDGACKALSEMEAGSEDDEGDYTMDAEEDAIKPLGSKKGVRFTLEGPESDENSNGETISKVENIKQTKLSEHQLRQQRLREKIEKLEEKSLAEKPWQLKGEVDATSRPQNSLLEEIVDFDLTTRPVPIITEETTLKLEDIIRQRVKDKAWDDIERKAKPAPDTHEFRKTLILDQEKSKASLAQVYEQEYLKQQRSAGHDDTPEEVPEDHKQIKIALASLFSKLDALSNYHYTPKPAQPEIKIVSNIPAISMEEVAPVATSDAALLAPEEVKGKRKGELMSKSERTDTDKKRERRKKKKLQREKEKEKQKKEKLLNKLNPGLGNRYSKDKTAKMIEKVSKDFTNTEKMSQLNDGKALKSSKAFFSQLTDDLGSSLKTKSKKTKSLLPAKKYKL